MNRSAKMVLAVLVSTGAVACDDATGPGEGNGQVELAAVGDGDPSSSSAATSPSEPGTSASTTGSEGTVHFRARVYLWTDAGQWVEVTNGAAAAGSVAASGNGGATVLASSSVRARSYTRARVVFEEVRAEMTGGVHLDAGTTVSGELKVEMGGGGRATVEREIDLRVRSGSTARLVIDLNSNAWMTLADAQSRTVSRSDFESAVRVRSQ